MVLQTLTLKASRLYPLGQWVHVTPSGPLRFPAGGDLDWRHSESPPFILSIGLPSPVPPAVNFPFRPSLKEGQA